MFGIKLFCLSPHFPLPSIEEKLVGEEVQDLFGKWVGEKLLSIATFYNLIVGIHIL
jgi:hypothetical protein